MKLIKITENDYFLNTEKILQTRIKELELIPILSKILLLDENTQIYNTLNLNNTFILNLCFDKNNLNYNLNIDLEFKLSFGNDIITRKKTFSINNIKEINNNGWYSCYIYFDGIDENICTEITNMKIYLNDTFLKQIDYLNHTKLYEYTLNLKPIDNTNNTLIYGNNLFNDYDLEKVLTQLETDFYKKTYTISNTKINNFEYYKKILLFESTLDISISIEEIIDKCIPLLNNKNNKNFLFDTNINTGNIKVILKHLDNYYQIYFDIDLNKFNYNKIDNINNTDKNNIINLFNYDNSINILDDNYLQIVNNLTLNEYNLIPETNINKIMEAVAYSVGTATIYVY